VWRCGGAGGWRALVLLENAPRLLRPLPAMRCGCCSSVCACALAWRRNLCSIHPCTCIYGSCIRLVASRQDWSGSGRSQRCCFFWCKHSAPYINRCSRLSRSNPHLCCSLLCKFGGGWSRGVHFLERLTIWGVVGGRDHCNWIYKSVVMIVIVKAPSNNKTQIS